MNPVLLSAFLAAAVLGCPAQTPDAQLKEEDILFFGRWDEPDRPAAISRSSPAGGESKRPAKLKDLKIGTILLDRPDGHWATARQVTISASVEQSGGAAEPVVSFEGGTASLDTSATNAGAFLAAGMPGYPDGVTLHCTPSSAYDAVERDTAGAAVAVLLEALASGRALDSSVCVLGGVNKDGTLSPISDAGTRIRTLSDGQVSAVIVAPGNEAEVKDLALMGELEHLVKTPVIMAARIGDAAEAAGQTRTGQTARAFELFATVQQAASRGQISALVKNPAFQQRLIEVGKLMPGHLSAKLLLLSGTGKLTGTITFSTSQQAILKATKPFWDTIYTKAPAPDIKKNATECANVLLRMEPRISPVVKRYLLATKAYLRGANNILDIPNDGPHARMINDKLRELAKIMEEIKTERQKLDAADPKKK